MMRSITRTIRWQPARQQLASFKPFRPISSTTPLRLKEDKPQDPQDIEKAKQEQMRTGKKSEELKSGSEAVVGAEQEKVQDHDKHMEDLQKQTAQQKQKEHPEGKS